MTIPLEQLPPPKYREKISVLLKAHKHAPEKKEEFLDQLLDKPFLNDYFKKKK